ncbi:hypothetical protein [Pseudomonas aeruginosa]|uniref:hypothetical protein n=1 Tax=Pseudomonas aeruginosa TaxID=287 RepID=UPI003C079A39
MKTFEIYCEEFHALEAEIVNLKHLHDFQAKLEELRKERYEITCKALRALGEEMGREFNLLASCPLDERTRVVLRKAGLLRKTKLDGNGKVTLLYPEGYFADGFYSSANWEKEKLLRDLLLCAQHRHGVLHSPELMARLGLEGSVSNEDR